MNLSPKEGNESSKRSSRFRERCVAILGGSFNPITKGHIRVAQLVLNSGNRFDEVWLMPCYVHMHGKEMVSSHHRLAMCEIASRVDDRIRVCSYEIDNKLSGETYSCIQSLMAEDFVRGRYKLSLIIGMDNANTFDRWVNYEKLERLVSFVVVPRGGINRDEGVDWYLKSPHIYLSSGEIKCSSTEVRQELFKMHNRISCNEPLIACAHMNNVLSLLNEEVYRYIQENHLYFP